MAGTVGQQTKPSFNYIESFFEIEVTPEDLKRIAGEIERMEQEFHTPGQVIRYKLSHNFAVVYRPEKKRYYAARIENPAAQPFHKDLPAISPNAAISPLAANA